MKKIVLLMLVAMIPFLTIAQKRSKKGDKQAVEYMVIKGVEFLIDNQAMDIIEEPIEGNAERSKYLMKKFIKSEANVAIKFDFGNVSNKDNEEMKYASGKYNSMSSAANAAGLKGWEFISANVVNGKIGTTHYYYMKRNK